jgi:hypothetical protein
MQALGASRCVDCGQVAGMSLTYRATRWQNRRRMQSLTAEVLVVFLLAPLPWVYLEWWKAQRGVHAREA